MKLQTLDIRILTELQRNADQTNIALAEKVGLSAPACLKRVKKLKSEGIIERVVAVVSSTAIGKRLNMVVEIYMKNDDLTLSNVFINAINESPEVKQCYKVTGEVDFVLIVNVADMFEYEHFCKRLLYAHSNMKKFTTLISLRRTKFDLCQEGLLAD